MKVGHRISLLSIAVAVCFIPVLMAKEKKQPIFIEPGFRFEEVDTIYILPAVDLMVNKDKEPEKRLQAVDFEAPRCVQGRGYRTVPEKVKGKQDPPPIRMSVSEDDLKEPQDAWVRKLGPDDAHWVFVLALEDASSHLTFGRTGKAIVMGTVFDRQTGKLVWRAVGTAQAGQGGLMGMAMKGAMTDEAIGEAVLDVCKMIEKRSGKKK
jgi:hypothetical protein